MAGTFRAVGIAAHLDRVHEVTTGFAQYDFASGAAEDACHALRHGSLSLYLHVEFHFGGADSNQVSGLQNVAFDWLAVDKSAVQALEIGDDALFTGVPDFAVNSGCEFVKDDDVGGLPAPHGKHFSLGQ